MKKCDDVPESQMVDQLGAVIKLVDSVVSEQIIAVPKISWPSRFPRTVLRELQKAEQLVEVPVPVSSFSDCVRLEETYKRTGHTWLGGFEWCLIPSRAPLPAQSSVQIPGKDLVVDVPGIVQLLFQQSKLHKQFIDRVADIPGFN